MRTCERRRIQSLAALALTGVFAGGVCLDASAQEEASQDLLRWQAPIVIEQSGAFVQLPLPAQVYTHSAQSNLADLRVVDARGERVPFALLSTPLTSASDSAASAPREVTTPAKLYPLPPLPGDAKAADGIELSIVEGRVSVRTAGVTASVTMGTAASATAVSPGWLIDLGEDDRSQGNGEGNGGDPPPRPYALQLNWSGPAEFSAGFTLTSSADLREWHGAGAGQVMALTSSDGALTQPLVNLPRQSDRYLRLVWNDIATAPQLSGAQVLSRMQAASADAPDAVTEIIVAPMANDPASSAASALEFDLGAVLPVQQLDLDLGSGTRVAPVRLQIRARADQPWQTLGGAVFYRIERGDAVDRAPALPLSAPVPLRYLRVQPDERAGALDAGALRLHVRVQLGSLVFASQGQPPYQLRVGSARVSAGALPLATLVPQLDTERARFGHAALGDWQEVSQVARREQAEARRAQWRPFLLWGVLIAGVLALGALVWRLARSASSPSS